MDQVFPGANVVAGVLVLVVGFGFHFGGQLISVLDWERATRWGLQEPGMRPEHRIYEHAIATADVLVGWTYGVAGLGLVLDAAWGYTWAWIPGAVLVYHSLGFWFWTANQRSAGDHYPTTRQPFRSVWTFANLGTGALTLLVASSQTAVVSSS